ncbi:YDG domain-containing protein, partial [Zwartia sp.]|uniref:two-partner secretion domain-containing protein n=1 Tax=Zwartia sp. TaxID=2978004 RepID=UPI00271B89F7
MKAINYLSYGCSSRRLALSRLSIVLALCFATYVQSAPVGGSVAAGSASISAGAGNTTIVQSTPSAVINWQGFSVGPSESVKFVQPSSSSVILNRVTSPNASSIQGAISANGKVFLVNPNGIVFGPNSQVNVGGMVASTLNITDANFMSGNYKFAGDSAAEVLNQGTISTSAEGGHVALLGARVSNEGLITARLGTVALAAGSAVTLDVAGDNLLNITVDQGAVDALVRNGGMIKADGGQVLMTARGAGRLLANAVNNTGVIQAQTIQNQNGTIRLSAGPEAGITTVSGSLDASGSAVGQKGGRVEVLGKTVKLVNAKVNASGDSGGGLIVVGGNFKGAGSQPNALNTSIDRTTVIKADAIRVGNGGRISVWSDAATIFEGKISARGGAQAGDGGFVETSGKQVILAETASVDTLAPMGKTGMWLLDPVNWTIATSGGDETPASIAASLASSDRTIVADNDINVNDAVTWSTPQDLTLNAGHDVNVNAAITASTAGAQLIIIAGNDVSIAGAITASGAGNQVNVTAARDITATGEITASSADTLVSMTAGQDISVGTVTTDGGGSMVLRANRNVTLDLASAAAGTGTVTLIADNDGTGPGVEGGTVILGTGITAVNTVIRFNPVTYALTSSEVAAYEIKIGGNKDVRAWVFTQAENKVYDTTTTGTLSFDGTPTDASAVTLNAGTATFDDKNVGDSKTVTYSGYSLGGVDTNLALYSSSGTHTANITPAALVVTATGIDKVYDATVTGTVSLAATPLAGDTVILANTAADYLDKNVGVDKTINVSGISLSGTDAGNYTANTTAVTTATITPAPLIVSATGIDKVYDTTVTGPVTLAATPLAGDTEILANTAADYLDQNVGVDKTINVSGISLSGADAGNYTANTTTVTT